MLGGEETSYGSLVGPKERGGVGERPIQSIKKLLKLLVATFFSWMSFSGWFQKYVGSSLVKSERTTRNFKCHNDKLSPGYVGRCIPKVWQQIIGDQALNRFLLSSESHGRAAARFSHFFSRHFHLLGYSFYSITFFLLVKLFFYC